MRKLIFVLFFIGIFGFIAPRAFADCVSTPIGDGCGSKQRCFITNNKQKPFCCDALPECKYAGPTTGEGSENNPCDFISDGTQRGLCNSCVGVWSAIGCIEIDPDNPNPNALITTILGIGIGIAGGIAFLLILFGGLQIMTSSGNPERMNAGKELVSSAIVGLLLILFSVFLLQFIGVQIIGIPGWK